MKNYEYYKPQTINEAIELMGRLDHAQCVAGGTDVMVLVKQGKLAPSNMISLRNIKELRFVDVQSGLKIGAGVTHTEIANNTFIRKHYSALADGSGNVGSQQIRNVATVGGNVCNAAPSADTACPLLVLDAKALILGREGTREVPLDEFFLGPNKVALEAGEIVTGFAMPPFGESTGSAYIKHARRQAMDLPIISIATRVTLTVKGSEASCKDAFTSSNQRDLTQHLESENLTFEDVRIAMGVVAPRPIRAKRAESALKGKVISDALLQKIGEIAVSEASPRDSIRGEAWYRSEMIGVLIKRAILKSIGRVIRSEDTNVPDRLW